jgi:hypothetical protein
MCWSELLSTLGGILLLNLLQDPCSFINIHVFSSSSTLGYKAFVEMVVSFHVRHWCSWKTILHMVACFAYPPCYMLLGFAPMHLYFNCIQTQMFHVHHFLGPNYFPTTSFRLCCWVLLFSHYVIPIDSHIFFKTKLCIFG